MQRFVLHDYFSMKVLDPVAYWCDCDREYLQLFSTQISNRNKRKIIIIFINVSDNKQDEQRMFISCDIMSIIDKST